MLNTQLLQAELFQSDDDVDNEDEDGDSDENIFWIVIRVGKKWEPRNPVPGPFSAKIRKVNQDFRK